MFTGTTGFKMHSNMCRPSLMTFTRFGSSCVQYSGSVCVFLTTPGTCISLQKLSNNTSAQAFLGPENAEVCICII